jgi:cation transport ATPase
LRALEERELDERLATLPDFFVEEVRLEAAAARLGADLEAPRDLEAELRDEDFTAPRLELREAVFLAEERDAPERAEEDLRAAAEVFLAVVFLAAVFLTVVFLAAVFLAVVFFAAVFLAVVFLAPDFAEDLAADLAEVFLAAVFLAVVFLAAVFLAVVFLAPDLAEDFAAVFLAVVFLAVVFLAPELFEPDFLVLDEPLRELLFFADFFLVLVAPVSPVNSIVSGFLVSVGIAASFKGLRVQPSRLEGNVVIPRGFRITESVDSRTRTFSVDMLLDAALFTCGCKTQYRLRDEAVRDSSSEEPT